MFSGILSGKRFCFQLIPGNQPLCIHSSSLSCLFSEDSAFTYLIKKAQYLLVLDHI